MNYFEIEKEMTKTYNTIAEKYREEAKDDWKDKKYVDKFLSYLSTGASVLDIGCGTGELLEYYSDNGFVSAGIDVAEEMIRISKEKVPSAGVRNLSLYNMDKMGEKFDAISATFVLVHVPKEKINEVVEKVYERLNDGGVFFAQFTTSLQEGLQDEPLDNSCKYYAVNYSNDEICSVLENHGFSVLDNITDEEINSNGVGVVIARKK